MYCLQPQVRIAFCVHPQHPFTRRMPPSTPAGKNAAARKRAFQSIAAVAATAGAFSDGTKTDNRFPPFCRAPANADLCINRRVSCASAYRACRWTDGPLVATGISMLSAERQVNSALGQLQLDAAVAIARLIRVGDIKRLKFAKSGCHQSIRRNSLIDQKLDHRRRTRGR